MNNDGPLRSSRPSGIRNTGRPESESPAFKRSNSAVEAQKSEPVAAPVTKSRRQKRERGAMRISGRLIFGIISVIVVLALVGLVIWLAPKLFNSAPVIDSSKYQAVQLTNGQAYFGKLSVMNNDYFKLSNVYYIQQKDSTDSSSSSTNQQLVRLSEGTYGIEDNMVIPKGQILFYENLQSNGQIAQLMAKGAN